jgi:uncharacterized membrane protein YkoI
MNEKNRYLLSWLFVGLALIAAVAVYNGWQPLGNNRPAGMRHEESREHDEYRQHNAVTGTVALDQLVEQLRAEGYKVLEVEKERKHGRQVYEMELLDGQGHVYKRYYDADSGEMLKNKRDD